MIIGDYSSLPSYFHHRLTIDKTFEPLIAGNAKANFRLKLSNYSFCFLSITLFSHTHKKKTFKICLNTSSIVSFPILSINLIQRHHGNLSLQSHPLLPLLLPLNRMYFFFFFLSLFNDLYFFFYLKQNWLHPFEQLRAKPTVKVFQQGRLYPNLFIEYLNYFVPHWPPQTRKQNFSQKDFTSFSTIYGPLDSFLKHPQERNQNFKAKINNIFSSM